MTSVRPQPTDGLTAGIKVRPPILLVAALLLGFAMDHLLPLPVSIPRGGDLIHKLIPGALIALGIALAAAGIRNFARAATPVSGNEPVRTLATTGVHGWSRNPIYVGMLSLYLGIGVVVRSTWILLLTTLIVIVLRYAVIAREEKYLEQRFGDPYRDYKARVRRWL